MYAETLNNEGDKAYRLWVFKTISLAVLRGVAFQLVFFALGAISPALAWGAAITYLGYVYYRMFNAMTRG